MDKTDKVESDSFLSPSQKPSFKQITLDLSPYEAQNLENYCEQTGKEITSVIKELIHKLPVT